MISVLQREGSKGLKKIKSVEFNTDRTDNKKVPVVLEYAEGETDEEAIDKAKLQELVRRYTGFFITPNIDECIVSPLPATLKLHQKSKNHILWGILPPQKGKYIAPAEYISRSLLLIIEVFFTN